jgi:hypothetical protein
MAGEGGRGNAHAATKQRQLASALAACRCTQEIELREWLSTHSPRLHFCVDFTLIYGIILLDFHSMNFCV